MTSDLMGYEQKYIVLPGFVSLMSHSKTALFKALTMNMTCE